MPHDNLPHFATLEDVPREFSGFCVIGDRAPLNLPPLPAEAVNRSSSNESSAMIAARVREERASPPARSAVSSLDTKGQSNDTKTAKDWTRKQKRCFQRLTSFFTEGTARGCKFIRLDLTTASGGDEKALRRHFQELRRRIEDELGFAELEYFCIDTIEGHGVLHTVLAYKGQRSFYVPHDWLKRNWLEIHGAYIVYVQAMGHTRKDKRKVSRYIATQYLADQDGATVRMSYSWWRSSIALGQAWKALKSQATEGYQDERGRWHYAFTLPMSQVVAAWEELLEGGSAMLGEKLLLVVNRTIVEAF